MIDKQKDEADRLRGELGRYKQEVDRLAALLANQGKLRFVLVFFDYVFD